MRSSQAPFGKRIPHALPQARTQARIQAGKRAAPCRITAQDVRDFLLAYGACFVAVMAFIA